MPVVQARRALKSRHRSLPRRKTASRARAADRIPQVAAGGRLRVARGQGQEEREGGGMAATAAPVAKLKHEEHKLPSPMRRHNLHNH